MLLLNLSFPSPSPVLLELDRHQRHVEVLPVLVILSRHVVVVLVIVADTLLAAKLGLEVLLHLLSDAAGRHLSVQRVHTHHVVETRSLRLVIKPKIIKIKILNILRMDFFKSDRIWNPLLTRI